MNKHKADRNVENKGPTLLLEITKAVISIIFIILNEINTHDFKLFNNLLHYLS